MCFHAPTCKLVSKSYARLLYNDYLANPANPLFQDVPAEVKDVSYEQSMSDKTVEKTFVALSKKRFAARVQPSIEVPTMCGNMYCASVYSSLVSLLANVSSADLQGKRLGIFSYGSGLASSMFSLRVRGSTEELREKVDLHKRLESRRVVKPEVYDEMCNMRERAHLKKNYKPEGSVETVFEGTYYLTGVDDMFRRSYEVKQ
ncbi:3-hydroxy-3-methylglutaryl coenzyme A synthase [Friedmanniomyces endolithicus]|nr:3-hydroxy-3-methylglutaryl coenzyme A synthase [Friedmanniomyces endolithicus]